MHAASVFQELAADFPCMVPTDASFTTFSGFVSISGRDFRVSVPSDCSSFDAEEQLKDLLTPVSSVVRGRLQSASTPRAFLLELRDLVERELAQQGISDAGFEKGLPPAQFYERLLSEISSIGWDSVASMNESMRALDLVVEDKAKRKHLVSVSLPAEYPERAPRCVTALPVEFELSWNKTSTLSSVRKQFYTVVEQYQDFFLSMEDLDSHAWVLEPERPTMRETYRRVALAKHCSMRVQIDPRAPIRGFPEIRFLGSEAAIGPFKERLNQNIHLWDTSGAVLPRANVEKVLEVTLPMRESEDDGEDDAMTLECGICYAYRLDDAVPDVMCDLTECSKPYHRVCLIEWLRALPDTRESFGTVTGSCVYCEHSISVSVPK